MAMQSKLAAGASFPQVTVPLFGGGSAELGRPGCEEADWRLVVVYRGQHCPLCSKYLNELEKYWDRLCANRIDLIAVSADSEEQVKGHLEKLQVSFPVAYGLTEAQMKALGLYISLPRSAEEADHNFSEPGLFVVNQEGKLHVVDISNNPFVRPDLERLVSGLEWIKSPDNHYPIRGTFS